jgi:predicted N-formylglutamate amidohydrolase
VSSFRECYTEPGAQGTSATEQAAHIIAERHPRAPVLLSCEHASAIMPAGWELPQQDHWLAGTHWSCDLGAAELTRELAERTGAGAVLARFTRLLIDPNRPLDSPTLFRDRAEGRAIAFNRAVDAAERERRTRYWRGYHRALGELFTVSRAPLALSLHSFTPVYEGSPRQVEIGVLFDREEDLAKELFSRLTRAGFDARLNEPYSGKEGLIYSIHSHAFEHGRRALELEVRQDLCTDARARGRVVEAIAGFVGGVE